MRAVQVIIKIFALCLAAGIIVAMFSGVVGLLALTGLVSGGSWMGDFVGGPTSTIWQEEIRQSDSGQGGAQSQSKITKLAVSVGATTLRIERDSGASEVRVESNNEHVTSWNDGGTLQVVEKSHHFWEFQGQREVVIKIPANHQFDEVNISAGAGTVNIDYLAVKRIKMELGAGKTRIEQLEATEYAEIEGGAGVIELRNGKLKNLDLELGAGKSEITAEILGNSKIHSGVGRLELNVVKTAGDYQFTIDKGLGSVTINGVAQSDDAIYGQGSNLIKIDSGVGSVEVKMVD